MADELSKKDIEEMLGPFSPKRLDSKNSLRIDVSNTSPPSDSSDRKFPTNLSINVSNTVPVFFINGNVYVAGSEAKEEKQTPIVSATSVTRKSEERFLQSLQAVGLPKQSDDADDEISDDEKDFLIRNKREMQHNLASPRKTKEVQVQPVQIQFEQIQVTFLPSRSLLQKCTKNKKDGVQILQNCSGLINSGQLVAIMGQSGCGKTTLLNSLSGRLKTNRSCTVSGDLKLNGQLCSRKFIRRLSGYVMQEDVMLGTSTPRETILFSSIMRLGPSSQNETTLLTEKLLADLGLEHCADTMCGTVLSRGISGGEKKRVSIGVELVTNPTVLFLDEPTSGLDSSTAVVIVRLLKEMAIQGRTVVCTVHCPSSTIFNLFDQLLLLNKGRILYSGIPTGVLKFFRSYDCSSPHRSGLSDYCMEILGDTSETNLARLQKMATAYSREPLQSKLVEGQSDVIAQVQNDDSHFKRSWWVQLYYLSMRSWQQCRRQPLNTVARFTQNVLLALFVGLLFWGSNGLNQRSLVARVGFLFFMTCVESLLGIVSSVILFHEERALYVREKATKVYQTSAYFIAKTVVEIPFQIFTPIVFGAIPYYMIGLKPEWNYFFQFSVGLIALGQASESLGLILGALVKDSTTAMMMSPLVLIPFLLVTGFFLNLNSIPPYLVWIKVLSPHKYVFSALMQSEFSGLKFHCDPQEEIITPAGAMCPFSSGEQVLAFFAIHFVDSDSNDSTTGLDTGTVATTAHAGDNYLFRLLGFTLKPKEFSSESFYIDPTAGVPSPSGITNTSPNVDQFEFWGNIMMCVVVAIVYRALAYLALRYTVSKTLS